MDTVKRTSVLGTGDIDPIAFLFHTVLEHIDRCYQILREALPGRKIIFDDIRALTRNMRYENWNEMLEFMLKGLEIPIPESV